MNWNVLLTDVSGTLYHPGKSRLLVRMISRPCKSVGVSEYGLRSRLEVRRGFPSTGKAEEINSRRTVES